MLGSGGCGELSPPCQPGSILPKPYAIMRSDSSDIRLFFFWTRYSSWFIHCVFWSAGVPVGQGGCEWGADPIGMVVVVPHPP